MVTAATAKFWARKGYGVDTSGNLIKQSVTQQVAQAKKEVEQLAKASPSTEEIRQVKTGMGTITVSPSHKYGWRTDEQLVEEAKQKALQTGQVQHVTTGSPQGKTQMVYTITPPKQQYPQPSEAQLQQAAARVGHPIQYYNTQTQKSYYVVPQGGHAVVTEKPATIPQPAQPAPDYTSIYTGLQAGSKPMPIPPQIPYNIATISQHQVVRKTLATPQPPSIISGAAGTKPFTDYFYRQGMVLATIVGTPMGRKAGREAAVPMAGAGVIIAGGTAGAAVGLGIAETFGAGGFVASLIAAPFSAAGISAATAGVLKAENILSFSKKEKKIMAEEQYAGIQPQILQELSKQYPTYSVQGFLAQNFPFMMPKQLEAAAKKVTQERKPDADITAEAPLFAKAASISSRVYAESMLFGYSAMTETLGTVAVSGAAKAVGGAAKYGFGAWFKSALIQTPAMLTFGATEGVLGERAYSYLTGSPAALSWQDVTKEIKIGAPTIQSSLVTAYTPIGEQTTMTTTTYQPTMAVTYKGIKSTLFMDIFKGASSAELYMLGGTSLQTAFPPIKYAARELGGRQLGAAVTSKVFSRGVETAGYVTDAFEFASDMISKTAQQPILKSMFPKYFAETGFRFGAGKMMVMTNIPTEVMTEVETREGVPIPVRLKAIEGTTIRQKLAGRSMADIFGVSPVGVSTSTSVPVTGETSENVNNNINNMINTAVNTNIDTSSNVKTNINIGTETFIDTTTNINTDIVTTTETATQTRTSSMIDTFINIPVMTPQSKFFPAIPIFPPPAGIGGGVGAGVGVGKGKKYVSELDLLLGKGLRQAPINIAAFGFMGKGIVAMGLPKVAKATVPKGVKHEKKGKAHKDGKTSLLPKMNAGYAGGMRLW